MLIPEIWQDWVLGIGNFILFSALLPSIFGANKPSPWTSGLSASILATFAITFWTLGLPSSAIAVSLSALAWGILFIQKIK